MLRSSHQISDLQRPRSRAAGQSRGLLIFSVGGRRVATRTEEVAGVRPWPKAIPVPSDTPFVGAMVRIDETCMAVYDLAAKLQRTIEDPAALCLMVKHVNGLMAIQIDSLVPSLHMAATGSIREQRHEDPDIAGVCVIGDEEVTILQLARLGLDASVPNDHPRRPM